ncbi:MAG: hypothetical protein WBA45_08715 [Microthrixaceae bacterium]
MQADTADVSTRRRRRRRFLIGLFCAAVISFAAVLAVSELTGNDEEHLPADRRSWNSETPGASAPGDSPSTAPVGSHVTEGERLGIENCAVFPPDHAFHADVSKLPVATGSQQTIASAGADLMLLPGFSSLVWQGSRTGLPINIVDSTKVSSVDVLGGKYREISDLNDHPIPESPRIEGFPGAAWDRHMLLVDTATCTSHEFFYVKRVPIIGKWHAETAAKFDLNSNAIRKRGSTKAAGTSMLAGLIRYDEVQRGRIDHVMSFSLPKISTRPPVWPASGTDGRSDDPDAPPMGTWFRLRDDVDLSGLAPDALVIAKALQTHGAIVDDTGPEYMGLGGENDERWNDVEIETLKQLKLSDFEVVDPSSMMVTADSYQIH